MVEPVRIGPRHEDACARVSRVWRLVWKIVLVVPYEWPYGDNIGIDAGTWYALGRRRAIARAHRVIAKHRAWAATTPRPEVVIR